MTNIMGILIGIIGVIICFIIGVIGWLIIMTPVLLDGIGLARICKKVGAFKPVWCWAWALLVPVVAILRAGDISAERETPYGARKLFKSGVAAFIVVTVLTSLSGVCGVLTAMSTEFASLSAFTVLFAIFAIVLVVGTAIAGVWLTVLTYISCFRIFKLYVPSWGAWLLLAGMVLLSSISFLIMPILSFLPMREN